jgi:hypothetical protein
MGYELGRLMWWLNQNAGAVQALSAAVTVMLTVVLAVTTIWYARLTYKSIRLNEYQLAAEYLPFLTVQLKFTSEKEATIRLRNNGQHHIRVFKLALLSRVGRTSINLFPKRWGEFSIRGPAQENSCWSEHIVFPVEIPRDSLIVSVEYSDMARFSGIRELEYDARTGESRSRELFGDWQVYRGTVRERIQDFFSVRFLKPKPTFPPKF